MRTASIFLFLFLLLAGGGLLLQSCDKTDAPFQPATPLAFNVPAGFPQPTYRFAANPLSEEGFRLGRKLFFDGRLSVNGQFPCSSCHEPRAAFTTFEHDRSHGYNHSHTLRNATALFNLAWFPYFRQDSSSGSVRNVSIAHIYAPDEMAATVEMIVAKLKADTGYQRLFHSAFGSPEPTGDRILKALDQYMISLVSADSKYDKVKRGQASFTPQEAAGYTVFTAKCATCHKEPLFTDYSLRNTGLPIDPILNDYGLFRVTGKTSDSLKFRVPTLRNLDFTSYYGHDGRFSIIPKMIEHYRSGVKPFANVDPLVKNGIPISASEEATLLAFLQTLNDSTFFNNPRYRE